MIENYFQTFMLNSAIAEDIIIMLNGKMEWIRQDEETVLKIVVVNSHCGCESHLLRPV